jgi:hypothetical protein
MKNHLHYYHGYLLLINYRFVASLMFLCDTMFSDIGSPGVTRFLKSVSFPFRQFIFTPNEILVR